MAFIIHKDPRLQALTDSLAIAVRANRAEGVEQACLYSWANAARLFACGRIAEDRATTLLDRVDPAKRSRRPTLNALERATKLISIYEQQSGLEFEKPEDLPFHLLADLRHWCAARGLSFDAINAKAAQQYVDDQHDGA